MESDTSGAAILQALEARRSMARVKPERPPRALVDQVVAAAAWAPNHFKTEPWRITVVAGSARVDLGIVMEESLRLAASQIERDPAETTALLEKERHKPLRAPVVLAVACVPSEAPKVVLDEELAAVAAAVQNMLIAAEAVGLGAMWRTGSPAYDPRVKAFLGFPEHARIVSFVYLGYPDLPPQRPRPRTALHHTTWMGWD